MIYYDFGMKIQIFPTILRTANAQAGKKRTRDAVQALLTALYLSYSYETMKK
jgi:hypothetical protein